jgi:hypothetical protein
VEEERAETTRQAQLKGWRRMLATLSQHRLLVLGALVAATAAGVLLHQQGVFAAAAAAVQAAAAAAARLWATAASLVRWAAGWPAVLVGQQVWSKLAVLSWCQPAPAAAALAAPPQCYPLTDGAHA